MSCGTIFYGLMRLGLGRGGGGKLTPELLVGLEKESDSTCVVQRILRKAGEDTLAVYIGLEREKRPGVVIWCRTGGTISTMSYWAPRRACHT